MNSRRSVLAIVTLAIAAALPITASTAHASTHLDSLAPTSSSTDGHESGAASISSRDLTLTSKFSDWGSSGQLDIKIDNRTANPVSGWTVTYDLDPRQQVGKAVWGDLQGVTVERGADGLIIKGSRALQSFEAIQIHIEIDRT